MTPFRPLLQTQSAEQWSEPFLPILPSQTPLYIPLGRLWEECLYHYFESSSKYKIISQNEQIIVSKQTLGAPDVILQDLVSQEFFHLEFAFKLYLLEKRKTASDWNHWRGTNAKDSLQSKWDQFHQKQFALLHRPEAQSFLDKHHITQWKQQWVLQGLLFVHLSEEIPTMEELDNNTDTKINSEAIRGLWCLADELDQVDWSQWEEIHKKNLLLTDVEFPPHQKSSHPYPKFYRNLREETAQPYLVVVQEGWPESTIPL